MGKALKDGRMLDLPLALPLCALIVGLRRDNEAAGTLGPAPLGQEAEGDEGGGGGGTGLGGGSARPLTLSDVGLVDASVGKSLEAVAALAEEVARRKVRQEKNTET